MKQKQKGLRLRLSRTVSISVIKKEIRITTDERYKTKLRTIITFDKGNSQKRIEETMILSRRAFHNWIIIYNESGMEGLKTNIGRRPKGKTKSNNTSFERLAKEINSHDQYWSIALMIKRLEEHEKTSYQRVPYGIA